VATPSDVTKVRVKLNEARMSLTKAENGLALSKMALYQLCGLDLRGDYRVTEDNTARMFQPEVSLDMQQVWDNRTEIKLLELGDRLARTNVRIATSGLLPNVAVSSSYLVSNPNILNGYQNKFGGMFTAGVVVNIPICHVNDIYAVKAARHRRNQVQYELEEAKGMIELQVNKLNYELEVANRKLAQAQSNLENAEENLRLADESFEAGVISSSDLMAAQTAWLSAKSEVVDAEIETRMDYLYLQQALGR
jgi:outer membrane protein TolC